MRRPLVIANWKMHTNLSDALVLATAVRDGVENIDGIEVVLCPPSIWLSEVSQVIRKEIGHLGLGAQNIHYLFEGNYTGEISAPMVRDVAKYVIVGHSERRKYFTESNEVISRKAAAAIDGGLIPIICVGEENKNENSASGVVKQLKETLASVNKNEYDKIIIAYEPVWAVGANVSATPEYCAKVITSLREIVSAETPIIYGGDVNAGNIYSYMQRPEIDGVLIGRSSLKASEFVKICRIVAEYKRII